MQGTRQSPAERGPLASGLTPETPWWMARASPVFAGEPAPTVIALAFRCFAIQLPRQILHKPEVCAVPVGAGVPAKSPTRCMAPASPVFAAKAAPTMIALAFRCCARQLSPQVLHMPDACALTCGSGFTREESNTVNGTGSAGVRGASPLLQ